MILDSLETGDTLRMMLEPEDDHRREITTEGVITKNSDDILILKDNTVGSVLSCRVLKSKVQSNYVPVKVLIEKENNSEVLDYDMDKFRSHI